MAAVLKSASEICRKNFVNNFHFLSLRAKMSLASEICRKKFFNILHFLSLRTKMSLTRPILELDLLFCNWKWRAIEYFCNWKWGASFNLLLLHSESLKFDFSKKNHLISWKVELQAILRQKQSKKSTRDVGKFCWHETNFRCLVFTKFEFWVYLEPPHSCGSAEKWIEW